MAEPGPGTIPVRCGHGAVLVLSIVEITLTAVEYFEREKSARRQGAQADSQRREDAQVVGGVAERAGRTDFARAR